MLISDILDDKLINVNLKVRTKQEVLESLTDMLYENNNISDKDGFLNDVYEREKVGQTGIGNYIAIPHGKSKFVNNIGVAIGITDEEVEWETLDGKGVKGIILFAVGDDSESAKEHLKLLSLFARKLGNDEIVNDLIKTDSIDSVIQLFNK